MKISFLAIMFLALFANCSIAQKATVNINIANTTATSCYVSIPDRALLFDYLNKSGFSVNLENHHSAIFAVNITKPQFIKLYCNSSTSRRSKEIVYVFYLSPGDNLDFKADFDQKDNAITVTGKGSNNNQPLMAALPEVDIYQFYKDTLPYRVIKALNQDQLFADNSLRQYITQYKPSAAFIKSWTVNLQYYTCERYYAFKENNKFQIQKAYTQYYDKWQHINDSLFSVAKLNNNQALGSFYYKELISDFMGREKERLWDLSKSDSVNFYQQWYGTNVNDGKKLLNEDMQNLLQEKIVNKYFTGASAEYLYAALIDEAFREGNPANIVEIFGRFKQKYPNSEYVEWFSPLIEKTIAREKLGLNDKMIFAEGNGTKINSLDELIELTKGKTVLLDMWGTWCGPCREEIDKNSQAIRAYFKGKGLDYFYVANNDLKHQETWGKLIAYFDLEGTHILANTKLSDDIMAKVKGTGYPTYVIIKKDGTYEQSTAGYPMKRDVLIKQLEAALAQ